MTANTARETALEGVLKNRAPDVGATTFLPPTGPVSEALTLKAARPRSGAVADLGLVTSDESAARQLFGAREWGFVQKACRELIEIAPPPGLADIGVTGDLPTNDVNALVQAVSAFEPADELEAMFAMQATAMHHTTMSCLVRANRASATPEIRAFNLSQASKAARTFALLVETLNRHRGKVSTQRVIVENVTVEAGGQAVVGAVSGAGSKRKRKVQAHAESVDAHNQDSMELAPLRSENTPRRPMLVASREGKEALPDARRSEGKRCTTRQSEPAGARTLERKRTGVAASDASDAGQRAPARARVIK
jgi:hypothetical protein